MAQVRRPSREVGEVSRMDTSAVTMAQRDQPSLPTDPHGAGQPQQAGPGHWKGAEHVSQKKKGGAGMRPLHPTPERKPPRGQWKT